MPCLAASLGQQKWILSIRLKLGGEIILIHYLLLFHPHSCNTQVAKTLSGRNYIYFCLQPFTSEAGADITINVYPLTSATFPETGGSGNEAPPSPSAPPVEGTNCPRPNHLYLLFEQGVFSSGNTWG